MLQSMDRLKFFYYVFSKGSVISAAKTLNVSQSAVSQSIQKLENEIKCPLFTRLHKQLVPTAAGERLFSITRPFMTELDACLETLDQAKDQPFGELRIGAPVEFGKAYLPAIVAAFREQYPKVTFYIKLGDQNTLIPMVRKGQIDFALVDVFQTQSQYLGNLAIYHFLPVAEEEIILACSKEYYERSVKGDHSFKHLLSQNFITYQKDAQVIKAWFKHHFGKSSIHLQSVLTVDSHQAIISAIQLGVGMGIVASHIVNDEIEQGQIIRMKTSKPDIKNQISLTQLQDKIPTLTEKVFEKFLLRKIKKIGFQVGEVAR